MNIASKVKTVAILGFLATSLAPAGCQGGSGDETISPQPGQSAAGGVAQQNPIPAAKGTPTGPSGAEVSPSQVEVGNFLLTMSVEPAQHMFDIARQSSSSESDKNKTTEQLKGIAVLGGTMLKATNNIDAAQNPPADSPQGEILRHVAVQIKDKSTGQLVPYLNVSMDVLRDGRPAFLDESLVPELPAQQGVDQMRYGNNVRFPRSGAYQIFVRVEANPIFGSEIPPAAQFNLTFK